MVAMGEVNRTIIALSLYGLLASVALADDNKNQPKLPDTLSKALKQFSDNESYSFRTALGGKSEDGVEGKYSKDQPVYFKADGVEFFKKADTLVYKQGEQWQKTKRGIESDPLRVLVPSAKVRETTLPHEQLARIDKYLKDMKQSEGKGAGGTVATTTTSTAPAKQSEGQGDDDTVFTAELSLDGCRALLLPADKDLAKQGKIRFGVNKDGQLTFYESEIVIEGKRGDADVSGTVTRRVTVSDIGKVKFDVPDAARKALE